MARPTQLWPGERMRTFFRSIFRGETGVSDELADRLADVCERHINRMMVWDGRPVSRAKPVQGGQDGAGSGSQDVGEAERVVAPQGAGTADERVVEDVSLMEAGAPWSAEHLENGDVADPDGPPAAGQTVDGAVPDGQDAEPVSSFDPFAFSVVVILARSGAKALKARLEEIEDADHLRELASAQHLGVDARLREPAKLRTAIVNGARQRLADRRAAAS